MTDTFYSLDTSALINGRRDLLPPEVFVSLWTKIEELIESGAVRAIDVVRDELSKRDDATRAWATSQSNLFVDLDEGVQRATREVLSEHPRLMGTGGGRNAADPFVIALARFRGGTVVTEETLSNNLSKPRIPDVCAALGVPCVTLVGFIREQEWTF